MVLKVKSTQQNTLFTKLQASDTGQIKMPNRRKVWELQILKKRTCSPDIILSHLSKI